MLQNFLREDICNLLLWAPWYESVPDPAQVTVTTPSFSTFQQFVLTISVLDISQNGQLINGPLT